MSTYFRFIKSENKVISIIIAVASGIIGLMYVLPWLLMCPSSVNSLLNNNISNIGSVLHIVFIGIITPTTQILFYMMYSLFCFSGKIINPFNGFSLISIVNIAISVIVMLLCILDSNSDELIGNVLFLLELVSLILLVTITSLTNIVLYGVYLVKKRTDYDK